MTRKLEKTNNGIVSQKISYGGLNYKFPTLYTTSKAGVDLEDHI
jgi:hypothetical protein